MRFFASWLALGQLTISGRAFTPTRQRVRCAALWSSDESQNMQGAIDQDNLVSPGFRPAIEVGHESVEVKNVENETLMMEEAEIVNATVPTETAMSVVEVEKLTPLEEAETSTTAEESPATTVSLSKAQRIENYKCIFLGAGVGIFAVIPFTAFHYFVYQPEYTSLPQWEFDIYTGAIQGALFCLVYRYALREMGRKELSTQVKRSFIGVRTLSRIRVPMRCTAFPLYCGDFFGFASWSMVTDLIVNYAESALLFGAVASAMDKALEKRWIRPFDVE